MEEGRTEERKAGRIKGKGRKERENGGRKGT